MRKSSSSVQDGMLKYSKPVATSSSEYLQPTAACAAGSNRVVDVQEALVLTQH